MNDIAQQIASQTARALLDIRAVVYTPDAPITFKSGIVSPIYVDNRRLPYEPHAWHQVIDGFRRAIDTQALEFDVIAGIETGGIPHSAALAYTLERPSVFVRKQPKEYGMKRRVEGGEVAGKRVLLIEDLNTTGGSSLSGVDALRDEDAQVVACFAIFSYGFPQAAKAFAQADLPLITLTTLDSVLEAAQQTGYLTSDALAVVRNWQHSTRKG
ncbi:MAG: orotate phosphoribosyltransferase [Anaerolineae bacterium]|nr:orotate phosphoribosyltransferase [Anaerolineae bacterium]